MAPTQYQAPETLGEALDILRAHPSDATILAGGTDLLPRMNAGLLAPGLLVDLRRLPLKHIEVSGEKISLGGRVTAAQVIRSHELASCLPALVQACRELAGPSVRNRATLGGNLANASPAADTAPPLLAYDGSIVLERSGAQRTLPVADLFLGPGRTALQPGEVLTSIQVPRAGGPTSAIFLKFGKRNAMAISVACVAVLLRSESGARIDSARIALGAVAPTPLRAFDAEAVLIGERLSEGLIAKTVEKVRQAISPIDDIRASAGYRREVAGILVARALRAAWQDLKGWGSHA